MPLYLFINGNLILFKKFLKGVSNNAFEFWWQEFTARKWQTFCSEMCEIDSSLGLKGKMAFFKTPKCQTNLLLPLPMLN